jgi:hypothetical protein
MKYWKYIPLLLVMPGSGLAQQSNPFAAVYFKAEGKQVYQVRGAIPGTELDFYSRRDGGKHLMTVCADETGRLELKQGDSFRPAFVLNSKRKHAHTAGNGRIGFIESPEFVLDQLQVKALGTINSISWGLQCPVPEGYRLTLLRATAAGGAYEPVQQIAAGQQQYLLTDEGGATARYRLRVSNDNRQIDYTTGIYSAGQALALKVYPVPAINRVYLDAGLDLANYIVRNSTGTVIASGAVAQQEGQYAIDISALIPGNYILEAVDRDGKSHVAQLIRQ